MLARIEVWGHLVLLTAAVLLLVFVVGTAMGTRGETPPLVAANVGGANNFVLLAFKEAGRCPAEKER